MPPFLDRHLRTKPRLGLFPRIPAPRHHPRNLCFGLGRDATDDVVVLVPPRLEKKRNHRHANRRVTLMRRSEPRLEPRPHERMYPRLQLLPCGGVREHDLGEPTTLLRRNQLVHDVIRVQRLNAHLVQVSRRKRLSAGDSTR